MGDFKRDPEEFKFGFKGMKLNESPDTLPMNKYALAINTRAYNNDSIRTRPGTSRLFVGGFSNQFFTDLRAYSSLNTNNLPRILGHTADDTIFLDTGTTVGTLAGGGAGSGAVMIPFRPNESPNPWMYIANGSDYQKFSAPDSSNVVTQQKVGIAEPQNPPGAALLRVNAFQQNIVAGAWAPGGTAGAASASSRVNGTVVAVRQDPEDPALQSIEVAFGSPSEAYQVFMPVQIGGALRQYFVQDVFPPLSGPISITGIYYFTGATGRCVITSGLSGSGPGSNDSSIYGDNYLSALRRGALIAIGTGGSQEICLVLSITTGPNGTVAIETSTVNNHVIGEVIAGVSAIQILGPAVTAGQTISAPVTSSTVTPGIGTLTANIGNPFTQGTQPFTMQDYISIGVNLSVLINLVELKVLFDVSDGTFTKDFYYYTIRPADIASAVANAITQLAASQTVTQRAIIDTEEAIAADNAGTTFSGAQTQAGNGIWSQILFPISALTRVGSDETKSLMTTMAMQFIINVSTTLTFLTDNGGEVFGAFSPDVGDVGAPYLYRVRPRSSVTGAVGNPSPATRYGVSPRRQEVIVNLPSAAYDPQIDTWDIERYGGSVTSFRYIGSTPSTSTFFIDNFDDSAAGDGDVLDFDNYEPWPSIDIPFTAVPIILAGTIVTATVPPNTNVDRFLPGNLVQIGGGNVYTLRNRPKALGGGVYQFEFIENSAGSFGNLNIYEPAIANQHLPYMWGPDVSGTLFACGDTLRAGTLSFAKGNNPDSAPDKYNIEIVPPSEPLLGGEIVDGLSFVASSKRWWALYPQPDNPLQRYNFVEMPFTRGLAAPYGHCTDGQALYWWAKDGIYSSKLGSLTDEDLLNLFPHEGISGHTVTYNGISIPAPDYAQAGGFRLGYCNGYLYAIYESQNGQFQCLVYDLHRAAWSLDNYPGRQPTTVYAIEQKPESNSTLNPVLLFGKFLNPGFSQGAVFKQAENINDEVNPGVSTGVPITGILAEREYDGGDYRAPKQWGDFFVDSFPRAAGTPLAVTPMSQGVPLIPAQTIPTNVNRQRVPLSVGGILVSDFMGLFMIWSDDFTKQTFPTSLLAWEPSFDIQPTRTVGWHTFGSSYGLQGFGHIRQVALAYVSTAPIVFTMTTFDGISPASVTLPSTGGLYKKVLFPLTANKGQLFIFQITSSAPFQIFEDDSEVHLGGWSRASAYQIMKTFGGIEKSESPV